MVFLQQLQSMQEHLKHFINSISSERGLAQNSIISYSKDLEDFTIYLEQKKIDIHNITTEDLRKYIHNLAIKEITPRSIARKISALKNFFNFLVEERALKSNPGKLLELPKYNNKVPDVLPLSIIEKLLYSIQTHTL